MIIKKKLEKLNQQRIYRRWGVPDPECVINRADDVIDDGLYSYACTVSMQVHTSTDASTGLNASYRFPIFVDAYRNVI